MTKENQSENMTKSTTKASDSLDGLLQKIRLATRTSSDNLDVDMNVCPHCGNKRHSNSYANLKSVESIDPHKNEDIGLSWRKFYIV